MSNEELSVFKIKMILLFSAFRETDKIKSGKALLPVLTLVFSYRIYGYIVNFEIILKD